MTGPVRELCDRLEQALADRTRIPSPDSDERATDLWTEDDYPEYSQAEVLRAYRLGAEDQRMVPPALVNAAPALLSVVRGAADLADQWDRDHADWCCARGCPGPGNALCATDAPAADLPGLSVPAGPIRCPGTCTCEVGRYRDGLRAVLAALTTTEETP